MSAPSNGHVTAGPSQPTSQGDNEHADTSRNGNNGQNNCHQSQCGPHFKGKCEALAGHVYELGAPNSAQNLFTTTTKEIAEYAAREYTDAGDFGSGLVNLTLPTLTPPQ